MKAILLSALILLTGTIFAHDEGHGPKLTDTPKQGGKLAPVIAASDSSKGPKASLIYKAELVRGDDDTVRVFLYDKEMNSLAAPALAKFAAAAAASVEHVKKGKIVKMSRFNLELKEGIFVGKLTERPQTQTFNVDVKMKEGDKELLAAFDGLEAKAQ